MDDNLEVLFNEFIKEYIEIVIIFNEYMAQDGKFNLGENFKSMVDDVPVKYLPVLQEIGIL